MLSTDAEGHSTTKIATVAGTLGQSKDANGYYQNFTYDAFGSLKQVTDSQSNTLFLANYVYGVQPLRTSSFDMDLGTWGYTPNALGEVVAYTDPKGNNFTATYDALSRPTTRFEPGDGTITWTWGTSATDHNIGQLYSVSSTGGTVETYSYDGIGRPINRHIVADASYDYDFSYNGTSGFLDTLTYPLSTSGYRLKLQYSYQYGQLQKVKDYDSPAITIRARSMGPVRRSTSTTTPTGSAISRNTPTAGQPRRRCTSAGYYKRSPPTASTIIAIKSTAPTN